LNFKIISYAVTVRYDAIILNWKFLLTLRELTNYVMLSSKNVFVLIHVTRHIICFSPGESGTW